MREGLGTLGHEGGAGHSGAGHCMRVRLGTLGLDTT